LGLERLRRHVPPVELLHELGDGGAHAPVVEVVVEVPGPVVVPPALLDPRPDEADQCERAEGGEQEDDDREDYVHAARTVAPSSGVVKEPRARALGSRR
jgi:hypothetical protein